LPFTKNLPNRVAQSGINFQVYDNMF